VVHLVCLADFLGFSRFSYLLVWFQVGLFRSTIAIIGDDCCSGAGPLGPYHDDLSPGYYNKLYYDKFSPTPVIWQPVEA
jgi:hypothetical protein